MGKGRNYPLCPAGKSPFETMFKPGHDAPELLVLAFFVNAARRWAGDPALAAADAKQLSRHLPADLPCVFMTTAPAHLKVVPCPALFHVIRVFHAACIIAAEKCDCALIYGSRLRRDAFEKKRIGSLSSQRFS